MYRLTVLYGHPEDPRAFDEYYTSTHIPLAKKMKGLTGWTIGHCEATEDGGKPPYYMIVGLYGESREALEAMLTSPEGQATVADVDNFATGGAWFFFDDEQVIIPVRLDRDA